MGVNIRFGPGGLFVNVTKLTRFDVKPPFLRVSRRCFS